MEGASNRAQGVLVGLIPEARACRPGRPSRCSRIEVRPGPCSYWRQRPQHPVLMGLPDEMRWSEPCRFSVATGRRGLPPWSVGDVAPTYSCSAHTFHSTMSGHDRAGRGHTRGRPSSRRFSPFGKAPLDSGLRSRRTLPNPSPSHRYPTPEPKRAWAMSMRYRSIRQHDSERNRPPVSPTMISTIVMPGQFCHLAFCPDSAEPGPPHRRQGLIRRRCWLTTSQEPRTPNRPDPRISSVMISMPGGWSVKSAS